MEQNHNSHHSITQTAKLIINYTTEKNRSFTTTDEGFLEKLRISNPFEN